MRESKERFFCFSHDMLDEALFGFPVKMSIATSAIVRDTIGVIKSEENLENLLHSQINAEQYITTENIIADNKKYIHFGEESNNAVKNKEYRRDYYGDVEG
ncbi:unnamed protein product [Parnassius apollo]|uniref:(apollo) hypothetical protein n=1 Tax=Parnassius apollo TaxID=110799 RepID=A0A8S3XFZ5_PARAO|nr:unnamed protein product [Parnassius apollo]